MADEFRRRDAEYFIFALLNNVGVYRNIISRDVPHLFEIQIYPIKTKRIFILNKGKIGFVEAGAVSYDEAPLTKMFVFEGLNSLFTRL